MRIARVFAACCCSLSAGVLPAFAGQPDAVEFPVEPVVIEVTDANGRVPRHGETLIHEARRGRPVVDTRGRILTFGAFAQVGGSVTVVCAGNGSQLHLNLTGLVAGGEYSLWLFTFASDAAGASASDADAAGALGRGDGASHLFRADTNGHAGVSLIVPRGRLSAFGALSGCLRDRPSWRIVGGYHPRGITAGTQMPAPGEVVEQFGVRSTAAVTAPATEQAVVKLCTGCQTRR